MLQNLPIMLFGNAAKLCLLCSNMPQNFARTLTMWLCSFQKRCIYACTGYISGLIFERPQCFHDRFYARARTASWLSSRGARRSRSAAPVILLIIAEICLLCWHLASYPVSLRGVRRFLSQPLRKEKTLCTRMREFNN